MPPSEMFIVITFNDQGEKDPSPCENSNNKYGKKGKDVRYEVVYLEESPLTYEEQKLLAEKREGTDGHFDLTKIYKSYLFDEAKEGLFGQ